MIQSVSRWKGAAFTVAMFALLALPRATRAQDSLYAMGTGMCIRPEVSLTYPWVNGAPISNTYCNDDPGQQNRWSLVPAGGGQVRGRSTYYQFVQIVNQASNMCLDLKDGLIYDGAYVQQWECQIGNPNQLWALGMAFWGFQELINVKSGKCLDVPYNRPDLGQRIWTYRCTSTLSYQNEAQLWRRPYY
jgi:hypothetical protein